MADRELSQVALDRAARAVHRLTGGGIPFAPKPRSRKPPQATVSSGAVAHVAIVEYLDALAERDAWAADSIAFDVVECPSGARR